MDTQSSPELLQPEIGLRRPKVLKADSSLKCMGNANVNLLNDDLTTKRVGPKLLHAVKHSL